MKNRKLLLSIACIAFIVVGAFVLFFPKQEGKNVIGAFIQFPQKQEEQKVVKIGYLPINVDLPLFVALEKGYFTEQNLTVKAIKFSSSNLMIEALVRGDIDAAASVASPTAYLAESKQQGSIKIFGYNANSNTADNHLSAILVKKNSSIDSVEQLKNKKVGTFPGTLAYSFTQIVLRNHGIDESEVQINQIESQLHLQALESGAIDALFTYEPTPTIGNLKNITKEIYTAPFESEIIHPWPSGAFVLSGKIWENDKETSAKIIRAFYKAFNEVNREKAKANVYLSKYTGIEESIAQKVPVVDFWTACDIDELKIEEMQEIFLQNNITDKKINHKEAIRGREWC